MTGVVEKLMEVLVLGGGAAGMMSAISVKMHHNDYNVTILEKQSRVGKKLSATGNGRCNISNAFIEREAYHGENSLFANYACWEFSSADLVEVCDDMGLLIRVPDDKDEDDMRMYPFSEQASSVVDILRFQLEKYKINTVLDTEVKEIIKNGDKFTVITEGDGRFMADKVIVALGGAAGRRISGSMSGYDILKKLGHSCTKLYPAIGPIKTETDFVRTLKGVRAEVYLEIRRDNGDRIINNYGEIQFTDYGISGPVVFEISREINKRKGLVACINFLYGVTRDRVRDVIRGKIKNYPDQVISNLLVGIVHNKIGRSILSSLGFNLNDKVSSITDDDIRKIVSSLENKQIKIIKNMNFDYAQVTMGGIRTSEVDPETMKSLICDGLYLCGEILDIDGDCGGYNLHWAWASGFLAGKLL